MRLAYITSMATGGLAGFNFKELVELNRLGVDVSLFISKYKPGPYMPPASMPVQRFTPAQVLGAQPVQLCVRPVRYLSLLREALSMNTGIDFAIAQLWAPKMRATNRDWIHCHWGDHKLFIGYYCHRLTGVPLSVTLHGYDLYANPNWPMLERSLNSCMEIITISDYNKRLLVQKFGKLGEKVKVIRLFTETENDPHTLKRVTKVLIVGGFQKRKGYDILLQALKKLDRSDLHLWVVGYKGPVNVVEMIKDLGLQDRVTVFGHVSDHVLRVLYTYCDIFCMPSRMGDDGIGEGLPVALMEAMAYEKPIVSTYHTGIPELVPDILVPEDDVDGLAAGLARLADNAELRKTMGQRNRNIVRRQYCSDNVRLLLATLKGAQNGSEK